MMSPDKPPVKMRCSRTRLRTWSHHNADVGHSSAAAIRRNTSHPFNEETRVSSIVGPAAPSGSRTKLFAIKVSFFP